jgi:hypothetical protein
MKKTKKNDALRQATCSVGEMAELFGLSEMRIQQLAKAGSLVKSAHGQYLLWKSMQGYIAYLRERTDEADAEFEVQRTRVYKARADILEAQAQALRGELHDGACIAEVMGEGLANLRAKLLAIPTTAAPQVADESNPNICAVIIETLLHEAMLECSKYNGREVVNRYLARQGKAPTQTEDEDLQDAL